MGVAEAQTTLVEIDGNKVPVAIEAPADYRVPQAAVEAVAALLLDVVAQAGQKTTRASDLEDENDC
jgi:hypothetical protein